jgi:hypothetical protein
MVMESELPQVVPPLVDGAQETGEKNLVIRTPEGEERVLVKLFVGQVPTGLRRQIVRLLSQLIGVELFGPNCKGRLKNASIFFAFAEDVSKVLCYSRRICCFKIGSEHIPTPLRHAHLIPYEVTLFLNPQPIGPESGGTANRTMTIELSE